MSPNTTRPSVVTSSQPVEEERQPTIDQPTNMADQEEPGDQQNDQPEMLWNLNHSTKNRLITSLDDLFAILQCGQPIPDDAKRRTRKKIDELICLLMDLSPLEPATSELPHVDFEERVSRRLMAKLTGAERSKHINHLVAINDVVRFDRLIADKTRRNLLTENRSFAHQLLDLQCAKCEMPSGSPDMDKNECNGQNDGQDGDEPPSKTGN